MNITQEIMRTISSLNELVSVFPELEERSPVKKNIQKAFDLGLTMNVSVCEPKKIFKNSKGQAFNTRIQIGDKIYFIKKVEVGNYLSSMEEYERRKEYYISIDDKPSGKSTRNGVTVDTYDSVRVFVQPTDWLELAAIIGKNINFDIVKTCVCGKCGGEGFIPQFGHVKNGVCFECLGAGKWIESV